MSFFTFISSNETIKINITFIISDYAIIKDGFIRIDDTSEVHTFE